MPFSQVQTHLENPTKYHIQQAQRQQVKEYLSHTLGNNVASQKLGTSPSAVTGSAPELAPAANSTPSSPMAVLSLSPNKEEVGDLATAPTSGRWSVVGCGRFLESTPLHVLACHAAPFSQLNVFKFLFEVLPPSSSLDKKQYGSI